jgi:hypothetical protein
MTRGDTGEITEAAGGKSEEQVAVLTNGQVMHEGE